MVTSDVSHYYTQPTIIARVSFWSDLLGATGSTAEVPEVTASRFQRRLCGLDCRSVRCVIPHCEAYGTC